jgi:hypothetical protein
MDGKVRHFLAKQRRFIQVLKMLPGSPYAFGLSSRLT